MVTVIDTVTNYTLLYIPLIYTTLYIPHYIYPLRLQSVFTAIYPLRI